MDMDMDMDMDIHMDDLKFRDVQKRRLQYSFVRTPDELRCMTFTIAPLAEEEEREDVAVVVMICGPELDRYNVTIPKALELYDIVGGTLTVRPVRRRAAVYTSKKPAHSPRMLLREGDYYVVEEPGGDGGHYFVKKEVFEKTYESIPCMLQLADVGRKILSSVFLTSIATSKTKVVPKNVRE
jgi:hypothetical protein